MVEKEKYTIEEFVEAYTNVFKMAENVEGIDRIHWHLHYYGTDEATAKIKALIDFETAKINAEKYKEN